MKSSIHLLGPLLFQVDPSHLDDSENCFFEDVEGLDVLSDFRAWTEIAKLAISTVQAVCPKNKFKINIIIIKKINKKNN